MSGKIALAPSTVPCFMPQNTTNLTTPKPQIPTAVGSTIRAKSSEGMEARAPVRGLPSRRATSKRPFCGGPSRLRVAHPFQLPLQIAYIKRVPHPSAFRAEDVGAARLGTKAVEYSVVTRLAELEYRSIVNGSAARGS